MRPLTALGLKTRGDQMITILGGGVHIYRGQVSTGFFTLFSDMETGHNKLLPNTRDHPETLRLVFRISSIHVGGQGNGTSQGGRSGPTAHFKLKHVMAAGYAGQQSSSIFQLLSWHG